MSKLYKNEDLKTVARYERDMQYGTKKRIDEVTNGSMAPDFVEMKKLGRSMDSMKTNQQLNEEGLVADPIQEKAEDKSED
ncbi:hypothetical protein [Paenibacillus senegalensis]|uniref:hypothetical protein n=1 Tax=Paenibacillus senegalensis TaxID=1465766 RepID=UPI0002893F01|nr:hypothetical protein [Paenibacillus senegalensis]